MLSLSAWAFSLAAVSLLSQGRRGAAPWGAGVLGLAALALAVVRFGLARGLLVGLMLAMGAASVLVLVLAPRPGRARGVALVSVLGGVLAWVSAGPWG